ncbi:hypothetical protein E1301_Tti012944 [Triplophysa tibetana]|uniref:Uncharacterized protein n=1 Tax=Triplophysa tibetana TaxID=1572043 RepID=A0A5A9NTR2_9TELE|nr:hypothetical protein E1301_Tti012944 [Triplophysa tibetana]
MVNDTILKQVVGAGIGALIGAFLGVTVCVCGVLSFKRPLEGLLKFIGSTVKGPAAVKVAEAAIVVETGAVTAVVGEGAGAAAGAGVGTGTVIAGCVIGTAALIGGVAGGITGWKAAEDADSVYDAMKKAAEVNYKNGKTVVEMAQEFVSLVMNNKKDN